MLIVVKLILLFSLGIIFLQDLRDRRVWLFLFPLFAILGTYLFFAKVESRFFYQSILINLSLVLVVVLTNYVYSRFILKKKFLKEAMGLGDVLMFIGFALSFPPVSFLNFFVFSILFTFVLHVVLKRLKKSAQKTIPLAGNMALFLIFIYLIHWTGYYETIYYF